MTSAQTAPSSPSAPRGFGARVRSWLSLVRFSHTLFALPWALTGLLFGSEGMPQGRVLVLVVAAMVGARTAAMAFNRLVDRRLDATNPRTKNRPSVTGEVSPFAMRGLVLAGLCAFVAASYALNPLCGHLSWPVAVVLLGYSATKRFTSGAHFVLGLALGLSPVGAALAARGAFDLVVLASAGLGFAVLAWTAGFDILYACQDLEHDRREGLFSVPARFGIPGALRVARACHVVVPVALVLAGLLAARGPWYFGGAAATALLLVVEHRLVRAEDLSRVSAAFFQVNVAIAFVMLLATTADFALGAEG